MPRVGEIVGVTLVFLVAIGGIFASFSSVRGAIEGGGGGASASAPAFNSSTAAPTAAPPDAYATTYSDNAQCAQVCGALSCDTCNASVATGIVVACLTCATGYAPVGRTCVGTTSACVREPWCSTSDAARVSTLHAALLQCVLFAGGGNATVALALAAYPASPPIDASPSWQHVADAGVDAPHASAMASAWIASRPGGDATPYFDDATAWYASNYATYVQTVPALVHPYLLEVKGAVCVTTWQPVATSATLCVAPPPT